MKSGTGRTGAALHCPNCGAAAPPDGVRCEYCRSTLVAGACGSCFGSVFVGMKHCPWCGADAPAAGSVEPVSLRCPRCRVELIRVEAGPAVLHECRQCSGTWVNPAEFQDICTRQEEQEAVLAFSTEKPSASDSAALPSGRAYVPCAVCGKLMNRVNFAGCSGVILDWCRAHGSWFDPNELRQVVAFIRSGGMRKAREREKTKLEEEKSKIRQQQLEQRILDHGLSDEVSIAGKWNSDSDVILRIISAVWNKGGD
jgi:Zn-finger nucleic acid-binding protein